MRIFCGALPTQKWAAGDGGGTGIGAPCGTHAWSRERAAEAVAAGAATARTTSAATMFLRLVMSPFERLAAGSFARVQPTVGAVVEVDDGVGQPRGDEPAREPLLEVVEEDRTVTVDLDAHLPVDAVALDHRGPQATERAQERKRVPAV